MNHDDHVRLIAPGIDARGGIWADFGAGEGAFTLALRDLIGSAGEIYAVDSNASALNTLRREMIRRFPETYLHLVEGDIRTPPNLPSLDGIVAANSLHYVDKRRQAATLAIWKSLLKPGGRIVIVEYDSNNPNTWVPYPVSIEKLERLGKEAGFTSVELLGIHPSRWSNRMYAALLRDATQPSL